jgi:hypothetical protein
MFSRLFADRREKKRKEEHERELKERLAKKFARYEAEKALKEETARSVADDTTDVRDYTEIVVNGKKLRVAKEHITIHDLQLDETDKDK